MNRLINGTRKTALTVITAGLLGVMLVSASDAGIGRNGIAGGRITAFGSIFVNGRELVTTTAEIFIDGRPATENDLKLGQNVFVNGIFDSTLAEGVADTVIVNAVVSGEITAIDDKGLGFTVLGESILTDAETIFAASSGGDAFEDFASGDHVRISGFRNALGAILATRVEGMAAGSDNLLVGTVDKLSASTFNIGDLRIDTRTAIISGFDTGLVAEGDRVRVRGQAFGAGGELIATSVEWLPVLGGTLGDVGEIEGLITHFASAARFEVDGIPVVTDAATVFSGGSAANLGSDSRVEVDGAFNAAGELVAGTVTIRGSRIRVYGQVDASNDPSLTVLGIALQSDAATTLRDKLNSGGNNAFTVSQIVAGDYVEARSLMNPANTTPVLAERIERKKLQNRILLQGFVSASDKPTVTVFGTAVLTTSSTRFSDAQGATISAQQFFATAAAGSFVKLVGSETSSSSVVAKKISLQINN